jgi:hypothetical protein
MAKNRPPIKPASLAEFKKAMADFAEEVNADLKAIEYEQAKLMMRDAMTFSAPMPAGGGQGLSVSAHKAGKNKLNSDVRRIFIPVDNPRKGRSVFMRQVINAVKGDDRQTFLAISQTINPAKVQGLSPIMQKIMLDTDWQRSMAKAKNYLNKTNIFGTGKVAGMAQNLRAIHNQAKGAVGGRWPKGQKYNGPQYFASSEVALAAYVSERQQKVGWVKAGYADAWAKITMPKLKNGTPRNYGVYDAPWVDANRAGYGYYTSTTAKGSVSSVIGNAIGNINAVADAADTKNIVFGLRVANLQNTVQARMAKTAARMNKRGK